MKRTKGTWGGRRPGAGRPPSPDSGEPHLRRPLGSDRYALVTFVVLDDVRTLADARLRAELARSFAEANLPDSFRLIGWATAGRRVWIAAKVRSRRALHRASCSLGARLGRAVNRRFGRSGGVLADRYHLETFAAEPSLRRALASRAEDVSWQ